MPRKTSVAISIPSPTQFRQHALAEVAGCILRDRSAQHGEAEDSFRDIAAGWSMILQSKLTKEITAIDVAMMMAQMKICRYARNPLNVDNGIDLTGYSGIGTAMQMREAGVDPVKTFTLA